MGGLLVRPLMTYPTRTCTMRKAFDTALGPASEGRFATFQAPFPPAVAFGLLLTSSFGRDRVARHYPVALRAEASIEQDAFGRTGLVLEHVHEVLRARAKVVVAAATRAHAPRHRPRATDGGNKDGSAHHWAASVAPWRESAHRERSGSRSRAPGARHDDVHEAHQRGRGIDGLPQGGRASTTGAERLRIRV